MLVIRLSRQGRKDRAIYRVVISEKSKDTYGDHLEQLGFYNPGVNPKEIELNKERIQYWISKGAQTSPTVHNLLVDAGIIEGKKVRASKTVTPEVKDEASTDDTSAGSVTESGNEETPAEAPTEEVKEESKEKPKEEAKEDDSTDSATEEEKAE